MPNQLAQAAAWLAAQQRDHASDTVYYGRGSSVSRLLAMRGRSSFDIDQGDGILLQITTEDFLIHAEDLVIDGIATEPADGDRITVGIPNDGEVFEVAGLQGQPSWRWTDEHRVAYRIHTKHVDTTP